MFEAQAKKWVKENTRTEHSASFGEIKVEPSAEKGFQAGAEFGYNKGKSEAKEIIKIMKHLLFDVWGYINIPFEKRVNNFLKETR
jgi:flagellar biosynthesis/type III secretory pathway protein FliH